MAYMVSNPMVRGEPHNNNNPPSPSCNLPCSSGKSQFSIGKPPIGKPPIIELHGPNLQLPYNQPTWPTVKQTVYFVQGTVHTTPPAVQPRITSANAISSARSAGNELGPNNVSLWAGFMYTRSYTMLYTLRGSYAVSVFPCVGLVMFTNILHGSRLAEFKRGNRNPGRGWKWMTRETLETRKDIFFQSSESLQSSLIIPQTLKCSWVA